MRLPLTMLLCLTGCATVPAAPQATYYVLRHLHTPEGQSDPI